MLLTKRCRLVAFFLFTLLCGCSNVQSDQLYWDSLESFHAPSIDYPKAAMINVELGMGYLQQGQIARAKSKLLKAKKLAPQLAQVHCAYAVYLEKVGENTLAEESYQKAIRLNPKAGDLHHHYGNFLYKQRRYDLAEKEFLLALNDPEYMNMSDSLENAAQCALERADNEKARQYFDKAARYQH